MLIPGRSMAGPRLQGQETNRKELPPSCDFQVSILYNTSFHDELFIIHPKVTVLLLIAFAF